MRLTSERLPWLEDPPPAVPVKAAPRSAPRSLWPLYLLLLLLITMVGAGAWWLSTGKEAAPPVLPAEQSIPVPITQQDPAVPEPLPTEGAAINAQPMMEDTLASAPVTNNRAQSRVSEVRSDRLPARAQESTTATRGIFPADEPAASPPVAGPSPIILYHPQPNRGRVVQLGAFPTRAQAEDSWKRVTRRYPYLATKPKMVNTVDVRGLGGGRPTRMYRLQLGTSSQAQSVVICQQLERAGHSCVVVY